MNNNQPRWIRRLTVLALAATLIPAEAATLKVGDPAPKLQPAKWIQGEPVNEFKRDHAYLVEFWATWCGPCRVSIPHLNELHTRFKDRGLVVIGQDVWEQDPEVVKPFVKKMGSNMTYRVALDGNDGKVAQTWMEAAGQTGIPAAFLVDKTGTIVWIGHPLTLKDNLLEEVLAGTFDIKKAVADYEKRQKTEQQTRALWDEFKHQRGQEDWARAESTLAEIEKLLPEDERHELGNTRFQLLLDRKDYPRAYKLAAELSDAHPDDASAQNLIAWAIATRDSPADRNLDLAEKIARRADAAAKGNDPEVLDTLARVLFLKGQKEPAIEFEQKAVQLAEGARKTHFQKNLDDYKQGKLPNDGEISNLRREVSTGMHKKDWARAEAALAKLETLLAPEERDDLGMTRFHLFLDQKDYKSAYKFAGQLSDVHKNDAMYQNQLAWEIATLDGLEERDLELAEKIARRGNDVTQGKDTEILDTLARILFLKGDKKAAIELQKKAVQLAKGRRQGQFQETLDSYKKDQPPKPY